MIFFLKEDKFWALIEAKNKHKQHWNTGSQDLQERNGTKQRILLYLSKYSGEEFVFSSDPLVPHSFEKEYRKEDKV